MAFSAHTDSKGIMDLVKFLSPKHVMLVHGEKPRMVSLKERIDSELGIPCSHPANNEIVTISSTQYVNAEASDTFTKNCLNPNFKFQKCSSMDTCISTLINRNLTPELQVEDERVADGVLVMENNNNKKAKIVHEDEILLMLDEKKHEV